MYFQSYFKSVGCLLGDHPNKESTDTLNCSCKVAYGQQNVQKGLPK